jgi:hypothetical protein
MLKSIKLHGIGPVRDLSASFGDRLNIITGDNGLGKSFLLDVCFWSFTGTWPGGRTALPDANGKRDKPSITYEIMSRAPRSKGKEKEPKTALFDFHSQTWTRPKGRPFKPGLVVYAAVDGSFAVWDPARNYWRDPTTGKKEGEEQPNAYQFGPDTLANGLKDGDRVLCNGLIADWVEWFYQRSSADTINTFGYLEAVINLLSHPLEPLQCEEPRKVFVDDSRKFPTLRMPYGVAPYPQWSAGVRRIISFAYLIVWSWVEHKQAAELRNEDSTDRIILIVDEIEAHLHPRWQRTILPAILKVVDKLKANISVQVHAATHSPLVLASVEPHFDEEKDQLFCFNLHDDNHDGKKVTFDNLPWAMHGDVVGWLTSDVFGLEQARSREAETAIEAAEAFLRGDTAALPGGLTTKEAITNELKKVLSGIDPFWPRWIVETK